MYNNIRIKQEITKEGKTDRFHAGTMTAGTHFKFWER